MITRIVKLLLALIFYLFDSLFTGLARLIGKQRAGICTVLYYHAVQEGRQTKQFIRQLNLYQKLVKSVSLENPPVLERGKKYSAFTFDDGFQCLLDTAVPELVKRGIPFTIFLPTGYIGEESRWITEEKLRSGEHRVMSAAQLQKLSRHEMITFGSHSVSHPDFNTLSPAEVKKEFTESRRTLEQILDRDICLFSYPFGEYNPEHSGIAQEAGYRRIFSTQPVPAYDVKNEYVIGRTWAEPTDWMPEFRLKILGAYRWLPAAFKWKRRLKKILPGTRKG